MLKKTLALAGLFSLSISANAAVIANYNFVSGPSSTEGDEYGSGDWQVYQTSGTAVFDDVGALTLTIIEDRETQTIVDGEAQLSHDFATTIMSLSGNWDAGTSTLSSVTSIWETTACTATEAYSACEDYILGSPFPTAGFIQHDDITLHFIPGIPTLEEIIAGDLSKLSEIGIGVYNFDTGVFENEDNVNSFFLSDYSAVSAVPVPAAAWLFGSALLGLAGIKRKRA